MSFLDNKKFVIENGHAKLVDKTPYSAKSEEELKKQIKEAAIEQETALLSEKIFAAYVAQNNISKNTMDELSDEEYAPLAAIFSTIHANMTNIDGKTPLYDMGVQEYSDFTDALYEDYKNNNIGALSYLDILQNPNVAQNALATHYESMLDNSTPITETEPTMGLESGELEMPIIIGSEFGEPKETFTQVVARRFGALVAGMRGLGNFRPKVKPNSDIPEIEKMTPPESDDPIVAFIKSKYDARINATENRVNLSQAAKSEAINALAWQQETVDMDLVSLKETLGSVYFHMANDTDKYGDKLFELYRMHNEGGSTDYARAFDNIVTTVIADKLTEKLSAGLPFEDAKQVRSLVQGMTNKGFSKEQLQDWAFSDDKTTLDILSEAGNDKENGYLASIKNENGRIRGGNNRWVRMMAQAKYNVDPNLGIAAFKSNVLDGVKPQERADYLAIVFNEDSLMIDKLYQLNKEDDFDLSAFTNDPMGYGLAPAEETLDTSVIYLPDQSDGLQVEPATQDNGFVAAVQDNEAIEPLLPREEKKKKGFSALFKGLALVGAMGIAGLAGYMAYPDQTPSMDNKATATSSDDTIMIDAVGSVNVSTNVNVGTDDMGDAGGSTIAGLAGGGTDQISGPVPGAGENVNVSTNVNVDTDGIGGMGGNTSVNVSYSHDMDSFGHAFAQAREAGLQEFTHKNDAFSTATMDEVEAAGHSNLRDYLNAKKSPSSSF